jgi:hypothetical protein
MKLPACSTGYHDINELMVFIFGEATSNPNEEVGIDSSW